MLISKKLYDPLKFIAQIGLPALGTLYFTLAGIWGLPAAEEVVGTIVALDAFLGVMLQLSSLAYANSDEQYDGTIDVVDTESKTSFVMNLDGDPNDIPKQKEVRFKVQPQERDA